jgi:hypothetical protein
VQGSPSASRARSWESSSSRVGARPRRASPSRRKAG